MTSLSRQKRSTIIAIIKVAVVTACVILGTRAEARASSPVLLVPAITSTDATRLLTMAQRLRDALAQHHVSVAQVPDTTEDFAGALDLSGDRAAMRYDRYDDELVRTHVLRLLEITKADTAIVLAAPIAGRIVLKRLSRGDGQTITLPDPCEPELAQHALEQLLELKPKSMAPNAAPPHLTRRDWILGVAAISGVGATLVATSLGAKRHRRGSRFGRASPSHPGYLSLGDAWRSPRIPMLISASVAAGSLSLSGTLLVSRLDARSLRWASLASTSVALGAFTWAASDLARGSSCAPAAPSGCVRAQGRLDRGILVALSATIPTSLATAALVRWTRNRRLKAMLEISPHATSIALSYHH
jgi:hypothetical protein